MSLRRRDEFELQQQPAVSEPAAGFASIERKVPFDSVGKEGKIRAGKLAGLTMWHAIWVLTWPVLIESFLGSLVGLTDTTLAAGISEPATDAIGGTAYFMWFINLVGMALGIGATALIARSVGRGRLAVANTVVGQAVYLGIYCGFAVAVVLLVLAPHIPTWFKLTGDARDMATMYLRLTAIAVPLQTLLSIGSSCHRGAGDALRPLLVMALVNVLNVALSFILSGVDIGIAATNEAGDIYRKIIIANPFHFNLGLNGVALGTTISWSLGGIIMLALLARGTHGVRLTLRRLKPHWHTMRRLMRISLPNFFETVGMWFGNILMIWIVGQLAIPGILGAHIVAVRIEAFSFMPGFAVSMAAATLAGQYLGANNIALARKAVWRCTLIAGAIMGSLGLLFALRPVWVAGLLTQQQTHLELIPTLLLTCGVVQIPFAMAIVFRSALRGAGDTKVVMLLTWTSTFAIRLPLAWLFCGVEIPLPGGYVIPNPAPLQTHFNIHPLVGFWIGLCSELVIRGILFTSYFLTGRWTKVKV